MKNKKADFLIIGAQKAGTTSLYRYLSQHPDLYFSDVKEVNYFVLDHLYEKGEAYYHSFFRGYKSQLRAGSAYVHMLPCTKCAARVKAYNPAMKLIVMLREPVERSWSAYHYAIRNGWESRDTGFADAISLENDRLAREQYDLTYFHNGLYHRHLTHWLDFFPKNQLLLIRLGDLQADPAAVMDKAFRFLELGPAPVDATQRYNEASDVFSSTLQKTLLAKKQRVRLLGRVLPQRMKVFIRSRIFPVLFRLNTRSGNAPPALPEALRSRVAPLFREDLRRLHEEFGISF